MRFDTDRKLIYIPLKNDNNEIDDINKEIKIKEKNFFENEIFFIMLGLIILTIGLVIFIVFYLKKYPRKKRMNEIEDDGDYDYKIKEENRIY